MCGEPEIGIVFLVGAIVATHLPISLLFSGHKGSGVRKVSRKMLKAVAHLSQSDAADMVRMMIMIV